MSQAIRDGMARAAAQGRYPGRSKATDADIRRVKHMPTALAAKALGLHPKHYKRRLARLEGHSMSQERMLAGFALYTAAQPRDFSASPDRDTIATPPGTRLLRIIRLPRGWRLWTATRDFKYGSYLELFEDGRILNCTTRADEGDDYFWSRPADRNMQ